jgi:hypothetical protein
MRLQLKVKGGKVKGPDVLRLVKRGRRRWMRLLSKAEGLDVQGRMKRRSARFQLKVNGQDVLRMAMGMARLVGDWTWGAARGAASALV